MEWITGMVGGSLEHVRRLEWDDSFSVGVSLYDHQHQRLVGYINDLYSAITGKADKEIIRRILDGLVEYTLTHFIDEEVEMYRHHFPGFQAHKEEHDRFIETVRSFYIRFRAKDDFSHVFCAEIYAVLNQWLQNHILVVDKQYSQFLNDHGVR
jgi:hemerythrin-like metal-binding protein